MRALLAAAPLAIALLAPPVPAEDVAKDLGAHFPGFRSAFVLRDVAGGRTVRHNAAHARARTAPCSTFKIPNSIIGLETGVVRDASFVLKWDGVRRPREEWNRDHDLASAIRYSVVWYYQELARRVGPERMQKWVSAFRYGNEDISGGIDRVWLGSSLRISPDEQVDFLARLHAGELPVSDGRERARRARRPPGPVKREDRDGETDRSRVRTLLRAVRGARAGGRHPRGARAAGRGDPPARRLGA